MNWVVICFWQFQSLLGLPLPLPSANFAKSGVTDVEDNEDTSKVTLEVGELRTFFGSVFSCGVANSNCFGVKCIFGVLGVLGGALS